MNNKYYETFYGKKISTYGLEHGYIDYHCFSSVFDMVLIDMAAFENKGFYFEPLQGYETTYEYNDDIISEDEYWDLSDEERDKCIELDPDEIYQYFIVSDYGAKLIKQYGIDYLFYCDELGMYIWGITHCGASWDYVLTNIPCSKREEQ